MEKMNKAKNCFSKMINIIGKTANIKQERSEKGQEKNLGLKGGPTYRCYKQS